MSGLSHQTLCVSCPFILMMGPARLEVSEWKGERRSKKGKGNLLLSWTTSAMICISPTQILITSLSYPVRISKLDSNLMAPEVVCEIKVRGAFAKPT